MTPTSLGAPAGSRQGEPDADRAQRHGPGHDRPRGRPDRQHHPQPDLKPARRAMRLVRRLSQRRDERGVISVWAILMASGVFLVLLGLVYDGGNAMNNRIAAHRAAEQAARAAADEMRGVRDGAEGINRATAAARANQILAQAGWNGTVSVDGLDVTVRVTGRSDNAFLNVLGFKSFPVNETGTATSITGPN